MLRYFLLGVRDGQTALRMTDCVLKWAPFFLMQSSLFLLHSLHPLLPRFMGDEAKLSAIKGFVAIKKLFQCIAIMHELRNVLFPVLDRLQAKKTQIM